MGLLDGGIASMMAGVMGQFYLPATLVQVTLVADGEGGGTETVTSQPCRVQEDMVREETRAAAGYAQNEKRFLVLQSGITGALTGDCRLTVGGITYSLSQPEQDPAKSYWQVRGVPT